LSTASPGASCGEPLSNLSQVAAHEHRTVLQRGLTRAIPTQGRSRVHAR
jgi:hypothetical protein